MTGAQLSFLQRIWLAFACFFRILAGGDFARDAFALTAARGAPRSASATPAAADRAAAPAGQEPGDGPPTQRSSHAPPAPVVATKHDAALNLLSLFQRDGRLVDFLEQDVEAFPDADIGAAARVVHAGCRRVLRSHFALERIRQEPEGATVTVTEAEAARVKLTGNVQGPAPYRGALRHAGWRATRVQLPELVAGYDRTLVCEAEVEL